MLFSTSLFGIDANQVAKEFGFYRSFTKAKSDALKEQKQLLVIVVHQKCPWCRRFVKRTLSKRAILDLLHNKFVTVILDRDLDRGSYPEVMASKVTPVTFIVNPSTQKIVDTLRGYQPDSKFEPYLRELAQRGVQ